MNRRQLAPGRESTTPWASTFDGREGHRGRRRSAWVALGPLALGMVLALGASPVAAVPPTPATGLGGSSPVPPVNGGIRVSDLDAAERLSALGERYIEEHALADAEAAFRGALAIAEAALGPTDPQLSGSMTASRRALRAAGFRGSRDPLSACARRRRDGVRRGGPANSRSAG